MEPIKPMEPKMGTVIPDMGNWISQIKWDGVRVLTYYDGKSVRLFNRRKNERTYHYPELLTIENYCDADSVILDGEVIALGENGRPSFHEVMKRDGIRNLDRVRFVRGSVPITYMVFDIIYYNGEWVNRKPLSTRLDLLHDVIKPTEHVQTVEAQTDGGVLFNVMEEHGMEGIVMKKMDSPYLIGEKKDTWLKVKNYKDLIGVIGGYTTRSGIVNSVLLGLYDQNGVFFYIGHSGTGKLSMKDWRELTDMLKSITINKRPFHNNPERSREANWVMPLYTVKVQYVEWTEGRSLRQPSIQSVVEENPEDCVFTNDMLH